MTLPDVVATVSTSPSGFAAVAGRLWTLAAEGQLLVAIPLPTPAGWMAYDPGLLLIWLILASWAVWRNLFSTPPPNLPLAWQISFLLMFTVGMPVGTTYLLGLSYLREWRERQFRDLRHGMESSFFQLQEQFPVMVGMLESQLREPLTEPVPDGQSLLTVTRTRLDRIRKKFKLGSCVMLNASGTITYRGTYDTVGTAERFPPEMFQYLGSRFFAAHGVELPSAAQHRDQSLSGLIELSGSKDLESFTQDMAWTHGRFREFQLGYENQWLLVIPLPHQGSPFEQVVVIGMNRESLINHSLGATIDRLSISHPHLRMILWRRIPNLFFPELAKTPIGDELQDMAKEAVGQVGMIHKRFQRNGHWYVAGARDLPFFKDRLLLAFADDAHIQREAGSIVRTFAAGGGLMFFLGAGVAFLLTRQLLLPVRHLQQCTERFRQRDFSAQTAIVAFDEIGLLAEAFNRLGPYLQDLEVGRTVQGMLLPTSNLLVGPWAIFGRCESASRMGGDYFDYLPVGQNRLLLVVGDVSGHGLGAALVMAMARALLSREELWQLPPAEILQHLHRVIYTCLARRKMMTCLAGLCYEDKDGLHLTIANAGQCFPFLIVGDTAREIPVIGLPLGIRQKNAISSTDLSLLPGSTLVAYSDGVVEARDKDGQQIGFERFGAALPSLVRDEPQDTEQAIRSWLENLVAEGPQEDDITIVVLQTSKERPAQASSPRASSELRPADPTPRIASNTLA
jgi:serine phosphatase RsbU (regulator of sigma subunit)